MPRITEMFCFACYDKDDEDEGVLAFQGSLGPMPMVGADLRMVEMLTPVAQSLSNETGMPIRIYKFTAREQIGELIPEPRYRSDATN